MLGLVKVAVEGFAAKSLRVVGRCTVHLTMSDEDRALQQVKAAIVGVADYKLRIARALRCAFDEVIDGPRTLRWSVDALEKVEKTYIGTKVELLLRAEMGWAVGKDLDYLIAGHEVDAKFSIKRWGWMIPSEAIGQICLLVTADDTTGRFNLGLLHVRPNYMSGGKNKDGKMHLAASHRDKILWLLENEPFPRNFLMHELSPPVREQVFARPAGQERVNMLFEVVQNRPIPAEAIAIVGREEVDVRAKAEAAQQALRDSLRILSGDDPATAAIALSAKVLPPEPGHYVSISRMLLPRKDRSR